MGEAMEEMDAELMDMMPASARINLLGMNAPTAALELSASFAKPTAPAQMQVINASSPEPM